MNTYQQESLANGATHLGAKGHAWRICPLNGIWQVYKLGAGWVNDKPSTQLTELYNHAPEVTEPAPEFWLDVVQAHAELKQMLTRHERTFSHDTLCDVRLAFNRLSDLVEQR